MSAELLDLAGMVIEEHAAWKARNAARIAYRKFLLDYTSETGEWFDRDLLVEAGELEDVAKFDTLSTARKSAQRALTSKRAAIRRAIERRLLAGSDKPSEDQIMAAAQQVERIRDFVEVGPVQKAALVDFVSVLVGSGSSHGSAKTGEAG